MSTNKIQHGQFYTKGNCFKHNAFRDWLNAIPNYSAVKILEPFSGANNIIKLLDEAGFAIPHENWGAYDIDPEAVAENTVPAVSLIKQDTLKDFPTGYPICITNPPYLAKNSAKRKGMEIDFSIYSDLFEISLNKMLQNCDYVAAIIPESFITRNIFTERLHTVISLNYVMFDDTDFPVCLALFNPEETANYEIYIGDKYIGASDKIAQKASDLLLVPSDVKQKITFNDPKGQLGLRAVDGTKKATIEFVFGNTIDPATIKVSSRAITRISFSKKYSDAELARIIKEANKILAEYRQITKDVFMTSFKGLREDSYYRRRLDFKTAASILNKALFNLSQTS